MIDPRGLGLHRFLPGEPGRLGQLTEERLPIDFANEPLAAVANVPGLGLFASTDKGSLLRNLDGEWIDLRLVETRTHLIASIQPFESGLVIAGSGGIVLFYDHEMRPCRGVDIEQDWYSAIRLGDGLRMIGGVRDTGVPILGRIR